MGALLKPDVITCTLRRLEKLTMPTNRVPKSIQSRTLAQSVFVNLVAQLLLSFFAADGGAVAAETLRVRWAEFASSQ